MFKIVVVFFGLCTWEGLGGLLSFLNLWVDDFITVQNFFAITFLDITVPCSLSSLLYSLLTYKLDFFSGYPTWILHLALFFPLLFLPALQFGYFLLTRF